MELRGFQKSPNLPAWGLLLVWLLLGGFALAEQVDLLIETSTHDEQALYGLMLAIKPGQAGVDCDRILAPAPNFVEDDRSTLALFSLSSDGSHPLLLTRTSTVPLFIVLSCYRI
jgi:hypothetical protein